MTQILPDGMTEADLESLDLEWLRGFSCQDPNGR